MCTSNKAESIQDEISKKQEDSGDFQEGTLEKMYIRLHSLLETYRKHCKRKYGNMRARLHWDLERATDFSFMINGVDKNDHNTLYKRPYLLTH